MRWPTPRPPSTSSTCSPRTPSGATPKPPCCTSSASAPAIRSPNGGSVRCARPDLAGSPVASSTRPSTATPPRSPSAERSRCSPASAWPNSARTPLARRAHAPATSSAPPRPCDSPLRRPRLPGAATLRCRSAPTGGPCPISRGGPPVSRAAADLGWAGSPNGPETGPGDGSADQRQPGNAKAPSHGPPDTTGTYEQTGANPGFVPVCSLLVLHGRAATLPVAVLAGVRVGADRQLLGGPGRPAGGE